MKGIDQDSAKKFHDGDFEALRNVIERYQGSVFGIGLKLLGSVDDAKDFSQDVFLHAYEKRDRYDPERPFEPWFFKLAMNLGRQKLRNRREIPGSDNMPVEVIEETACKGVLEGERKERVRHALTTLKPIYRECLALRFEADLKLHEIAEVLGISPETVKTRLRRGLMAFKESYTKAGDYSELQKC